MRPLLHLGHHAPGFLLKAVVVVGLSVGTFASVMVALDRALYRPLPYPKPADLVQVHRDYVSGPRPHAVIEHATLIAARHALPSVADFGYATGETTKARIGSDSRDNHLELAGVTHNLLTVLGVRPAVGRDFVETDTTEAARPVLLAHTVWRTRFGATTDLDAIRLGRVQDIRVVGVLPAGFVLPSSLLPERLDGVQVMAERFSLAATTRGQVVAPVARLKSGASIATLEQQLNALAKSLDADGPSAHPVASGRPIRVTPLRDALIQSHRGELVWLVAIGIVVVGVAALTLSIIILARLQGRLVELRVRTALGASRLRLLGLIGADSTVILVCGAAASLITAVAMSPVAARLVPPVLLAFRTEPTDGRIIVLLAVAALACVWIGTLIPALFVCRVAPSLQLGNLATRGSRLFGGRLLLTVQSALGTVVITGAVVALVAVGRIALRTGFDARGLHLVVLSTDGGDATGIPAMAVEAVRAIPGVSNVGYGDGAPVEGANFVKNSFWRRLNVAGVELGVDEQFLPTLGASFVVGRNFSSQEIAAREPVAVISVRAAQLLWPEAATGEVLNRALTMPNGDRNVVIGVVRDLLTSPRATPPPAVFMPFGTHGIPRRSSNFYLLARAPAATPLNGAVVNQALRTAGVTSGASVEPLEARVERWLRQPTLYMFLLGWLSVVTTVLFVAGTAAVARFNMLSRSHADAIRLALGAPTGAVQRQALWFLLRPIGVGGGIGVFGAWLGRDVAASLVQLDGALILPAALLALTVGISAAILAIWTPLRDVARLEPAAVLRRDGGLGC